MAAGDRSRFFVNAAQGSVRAQFAVNLLACHIERSWFLALHIVVFSFLCRVCWIWKEHEGVYRRLRSALLDFVGVSIVSIICTFAFFVYCFATSPPVHTVVLPRVAFHWRAITHFPVSGELLCRSLCWPCMRSLFPTQLFGVTKIILTRWIWDGGMLKALGFLGYRKDVRELMISFVGMDMEGRKAYMRCWGLGG